MQNSSVSMMSERGIMREISNIAGLANLENSCFMNVVLQSLTYLSPLTDYIAHDIINCETPQKCMLCLLEGHLT